MAYGATPLYESRRTVRSLWQRYRIFPDRVELSLLWLLKITIPIHEIVAVDVFPPLVIRTSLWALKLDLADLFRHVGITRRSGLFKHLRFTPDDPERFVTVLRGLVA